MIKVLYSKIRLMEEIRQTTWQVWNPVKHKVKYIPISTGERRISEPSTVVLLIFPLLPLFGQTSRYSIGINLRFHTNQFPVFQIQTGISSHPISIAFCCSWNNLPPQIFTPNHQWSRLILELFVRLPPKSATTLSIPSCKKKKSIQTVSETRFKVSKKTPTYPGNIPQTLNHLFVKEILSYCIWGT